MITSSASAFLDWRLTARRLARRPRRRWITSKRTRCAKLPPVRITRSASAITTSCKRTTITARTRICHWQLKQRFTTMRVFTKIAKFVDSSIRTWMLVRPSTVIIFWRIWVTSWPKCPKRIAIRLARVPRVKKSIKRCSWRTTRARKTSFQRLSKGPFTTTRRRAKPTCATPRRRPSRLILRCVRRRPKPSYPSWFLVSLRPWHTF